MKRKPLLKNLCRPGHDDGPMIAHLPPILRDPINSDLLFDCELPPGNDLLATYTNRVVSQRLSNGGSRVRAYQADNYSQTKSIASEGGKESAIPG